MGVWDPGDLWSRRFRSVLVSACSRELWRCAKSWRLRGPTLEQRFIRLGWIFREDLQARKRICIYLRVCSIVHVVSRCRSESWIKQTAGVQGHEGTPRFPACVNSVQSISWLDSFLEPPSWNTLQRLKRTDDSDNRQLTARWSKFARFSGSALTSAHCQEGGRVRNGSGVKEGSTQRSEPGEASEN